MRFPASLEGVLRQKVQEVLARHENGEFPEWAYDRTAAGDLLVVFQPIPEPVGMRFTLDEGYVTPEPASGVAEDDGA